MGARGLVEAVTFAAVLVGLGVFTWWSGLGQLGFTVLAVLAVLGVSFAFAVRRHRRWREFGEALGFVNAEAGAPLAWLRGLDAYSGVHAGRAATLYTFTRGSGKSRQTWTAIALATSSPPDLRLRVTKQGVGAFFAKAFGGQDVEVGDAAFDGAFRIEASDPERARRILDYRAQEAIARADLGEVLIEAGEAKFHKKGQLDDTEVARAALDALASIAAGAERGR